MQEIDFSSQNWEKFCAETEIAQSVSVAADTSFASSLFPQNHVWNYCIYWYCILGKNLYVVVAYIYYCILKLSSLLINGAYRLTSETKLSSAAIQSFHLKFLQEN